MKIDWEKIHLYLDGNLNESEKIGQVCNSIKLRYSYECDECICREEDKKSLFLKV